MRIIPRQSFAPLLATALFSIGCGSDADPVDGAGAGKGAATKTIDLGLDVHVVAGSDAALADGSEAHPFGTVGAAAAAIDADEGWNGTLRVHAGRYEIYKDVILPIGAKLEVESGATLAFAELVCFHAQGDIKMLGTADAPITMTWLTQGKHWSSLTNYEPTSQDNVFKYVIFEHGYENNFRDISERGVLSLNQAKALISNCTFRDNEGDDALTLVKSESIVEYSKFLNNASDAIDQGYSYSEIRFNHFEGNGNDAIDLGDGSSAWAHDNVAVRNGDKGVSLGEACVGARIENNLLVGNGIGIGIKDGSEPVIRNNTLYDNDFGVISSEAIAGLGSGKGSFSGGIIWNSRTADLDLSSDSQTVFSHSCIKNPNLAQGGTLTGVGILSPGKGCDDPLFVDPANQNFRLKSAAGHWDETTATWITDSQSSPAIDAGDPAADASKEPPPNGSRVNLGYDGNTDKASKSSK